MSLDSVELQIAVEEEFDIQIPNIQAAKIVTVGDLVDQVQALVNGVDAKQSEAEWLKLDRKFKEVTGRMVSDLPTETKLVDLLDPERENSQWKALELEPELEKPRWIGRLVNGFSAFVGISVMATSPGPWTFRIGFGVFSWVGCGIALQLMTSVLFQEIPDRGRTLEDLVWWKEGAAGGSQKIPREKICDRVVDIVVAQLSVKREEVEESSRFIEDLRMD